MKKRIEIKKPNKDDDLMRKILNPTTRQDIYDTIPNAKAIFEGGGVKPRSMAPAAVTPLTKYAVARQERMSARKEMLTKRAKEHFDKMLQNRLSDIEKNCK